MYDTSIGDKTMTLKVKLAKKHKDTDKVEMVVIDTNYGNDVIQLDTLQYEQGQLYTPTEIFNKLTSATHITHIQAYIQELHNADMEGRVSTDDYCYRCYSISVEV
jgi:hypothetical protein